MIQAKGNGQSECFKCKQMGKFSLNWTSMMFKTKKDNFEHLYCYEHAKEMEGE